MTAVVPIGVGFYTVPEAARLIGMEPRRIRRWLGGYSYSDRTGAHEMEPLWTPQLPQYDGHMELSFRDLIELRFVHAFTEAGVGLKAIRNCLDVAREAVNDQRPFSTRRFKTDGKTIFLESLNRITDESELLDLRKQQYAIPAVLQQAFKDLDIAEDVVSRWRPYKGKESIVIDPTRAFGQPIASASGIPTATLNDACQAEGSLRRVSYLYDVATSVVRDAQNFQTQLMAA